MKIVSLLALLPALVLVACGGEGAADAEPGRPRLAFVTNYAVPFWAIAERGCVHAAAEHDVEVSVQMPPNGTGEEQTRILEDLLAKGVDGIAVTPKNPEDMTPLLNRVAARTLLITHDSDAPASDRLCYIGMDNYDAGRQCGRMIKAAVPGGGPLVIVVGDLAQDNAKRRRQGLIDELLGRDHDPERFDAQDAALQAAGWEIRATYVDQGDQQKTRAVCEDALTRWSDLVCMVGLFAYEPPVLLQVVEDAGRLDEITIAAFDEDELTLQGIVDGKICGTVVQNPYEYGRQSIALLSRLVRAPDAAARQALLPDDGFIDIPARTITQDNVAAFWADLKQKMGR